MGRARALAITSTLWLGAAAPAAVARAQAPIPAPAPVPACEGLVDAGPLIAGPGPADFGQVPEACPGRDLGLRLRGELLANPADFYGVITAGATLRARWSFWQRWYVSAALDPATWRMPINAVVSSTGVGVGPGTLGLHRQFLWRRLALTPYARVLLPIDTARRHGARHGAELGGAASRRVRKRWNVHGGLAFPATLVVIGGTGHGQVHGNALGEASFTPRPWISVAAGAAMRLQLAPRSELAALAARASVRAATRGGWHFGLGADLPFAGVDRTDVTATLFAGWAAPSPSPSPQDAR